MCRLGIAMRRQPDTPDVVVARIAARQYGVVSFGQLSALGLSKGALARRVQAGRLHRIHRGIYAVGHVGLAVDGGDPRLRERCASTRRSRRTAARSDHAQRPRPLGRRPQPPQRGRPVADAALASRARRYFRLRYRRQGETQRCSRSSLPDADHRDGHQPQENAGDDPGTDDRGPSPGRPDEGPGQPQHSRRKTQRSGRGTPPLPAPSS